MPKLSKRMKKINQEINTEKSYPVLELFEILKNNTVKFKESIDIAINLSIDPRKPEQAIRGNTIFPNNSNNKIVKVAVFADGEHAIEGKKAGADFIGMNELYDKIKNNKISFDVVVATPNSMPIIGKLGKILGPKGLMPNAKFGTLTNNIFQTVKNIKNGQIRYRVDKYGIIHTKIGKSHLSSNQLKENLEQLIKDLIKLKPNNLKGKYINNIIISSTMGPGLILDMNTINV